MTTKSAELAHDVDGNGKSLHHGGAAETGAGQYLQPNGQSGTDLSRQISVQLTPQQFEELYLQPSMKSRQQTQLIKALGNPTALGIICFILNLFPTSCLLMGFRSQTAAGLVSLTGVYYLTGGLGMIVAGILEWIVGNTFPFLVFFTFGTFWASLAVYGDPQHAVQATNATNAPDLYAPIAFFLLAWGIYTFFLTIASLRTNVILVAILFCVAMTFTTLSAAYFHLAEAGATVGSRLTIGAGAFGFAACIFGFYILFHLVLATTEFPFNVPLGDLSGFLRKR